MSDYYTLGKGWWAQDSEMAQTVIDWYNSQHDTKIQTTTGKGDPKARPGDQIDAWRHAGTAALLAYENGYDFTIKVGNALEEYRPGPLEENLQDYYNNEVGARLGNMARLLGWGREELGDVLKYAYQNGYFINDAYARSYQPVMDIALPNGFILRQDNHLERQDLVVPLNVAWEEGDKQFVRGFSKEGAKGWVIIDRVNRKLISKIKAPLPPIHPLPAYKMHGKFNSPQEGELFEHLLR